MCKEHKKRLGEEAIQTVATTEVSIKPIGVSFPSEVPKKWALGVCIQDTEQDEKGKVGPSWNSRPTTGQETDFGAFRTRPCVSLFMRG